ncbi:F-box only protein 4 [Elgaria multicarinata webbii]|uniref:F-box only protein 4 n=1 Tax=Elgaria multicarinata webbii TaxID=159646 RepID=UPI002FCD0434
MGFRSHVYFSKNVWFAIAAMLGYNLQGEGNTELQPPKLQWRAWMTHSSEGCDVKSFCPHRSNLQALPPDLAGLTNIDYCSEVAQRGVSLLGSGLSVRRSELAESAPEGGDWQEPRRSGLAFPSASALPLSSRRRNRVPARLAEAPLPPHRERCCARLIGEPAGPEGSAAPRPALAAPPSAFARGFIPAAQQEQAARFVFAAAMAADDGGGDWRRLESALRGRLRLLRDKWGARGARAEEPGDEKQQWPSGLEALPIDVKLYIMSFLTPKDLCYLGSTNHYWKLTVQDPLLWKYLLIRDLPSWHSVDWKSLPDPNIFNRSVAELHNSASCDYMAVYKKCCSCRKRCPKSTYGAMASFLQSLMTPAEPRFAMFGPGLEDLDESLVHKLMTSPEVLLLAGIPSRQIHGIGSGVTFHLNGQKFNILTLYSKTCKERRRAREEDTNLTNKMFIEENGVDGTTQYNLIEHVKNMCGLIDGFIYVANAEAHKRHSRQIEFARMAAMLDPTLGPSGRPLLILSCISSAGIERIPCVYVAHQLQLHQLGQPWMVQDTEAATLAGLLDGIQWLLEQTEHKNTQ